MDVSSSSGVVAVEDVEVPVVPVGELIDPVVGSAVPALPPVEGSGAVACVTESSVPAMPSDEGFCGASLTPQPAKTSVGAKQAHRRDIGI